MSIKFADRKIWNIIQGTTNKYFLSDCELEKKKNN